MVLKVATDIGTTFNHFEYESTKMKTSCLGKVWQNLHVTSPKNVEDIPMEIVSIVEARINYSDKHHTP